MSIVTVIQRKTVHIEQKAAFTTNDLYLRKGIIE